MRKKDLPILIKDEYPEPIKEFLRMYNELAPSSVPQFARDLEVPLHVVKNITQGNQKSISPELAKALPKIDPQKRPVSFWLTGEMPTDLDNLICDETPNDFIKIPYYPDIEASCGSGVFAPENLPTPENFMLPARMLNKRSKYFIIPAVGNSMEKTIYDKELVVLEDWTGKQIVDDKIYFFCYNNKHYIKRLVHNIDEVVVISDNSERDADGKRIHETKSIKGEDINNLKIYGRFKARVEDF